MLGEDNLLAEGLEAVGTDEGSLPRVDALVPGQVAPLTEGLPAGVALEGLPAGVEDHMLVQDGLLGKGLAADGALEGLLPGVYPGVDVEAAGMGVGLGTQ